MDKDGSEMQDEGRQDTLKARARVKAQETEQSYRILREAALAQHAGVQPLLRVVRNVISDQNTLLLIYEYEGKAKTIGMTPTYSVAIHVDERDRILSIELTNASPNDFELLVMIATERDLSLDGVADMVKPWWRLIMFLQVVDTEENPDPVRLSGLPKALGWVTSRTLVRGEPMYKRDPSPLFKRNGFDVTIAYANDANIVDNVEKALVMLEVPGVYDALIGLEKRLIVGITFFEDHTPEASLEVDTMRRLVAAEVNYDLDIDLWNKLPYAETEALD